MSDKKNKRIHSERVHLSYFTAMIMMEIEGALSPTTRVKEANKRKSETNFLSIPTTGTLVGDIFLFLFKVR